MSKTEIEVRGPLTKEKFKELQQFLEKNGKFQHKSKRLSVCYTILRPEDKEVSSDLDIRARVTDDEPELVIKVGKWRGSDIRREVSVQVKRGEFSNLIAVCATLGYTEAIVSESLTFVYDYQGVEFSLVNKSDHSYFFEAEVLVESSANKDQVQLSIQTLCKQLDLTLFTDEQFFDYIKLLNREVNSHFDWARDGESFFKDKYGF